MTKEEQKVREEIKDIILNVRSSAGKYNSAEISNGEISDLILNIKGLGIIDDDKSLPANPWGIQVHLDAGIYDGLYRHKYVEAQQDMLAANFVKLIKGRNKTGLGQRG